MEKKQLNNAEMQDLAEAISKLSEEEQAQIAAAGAITNEQCERIKSYARVDCDYGAPCPGVVIFKQLTKLKKTEMENQPPIVPKNPMDVN